VSVAAGRSILVTGASTGIGRAAVLALLTEGFRVFAAVRNERSATELRQAVQAGGDGRLETLELDVTNSKQIRAALARITTAVGDAGLWGLFNNAGIAVSGPLECLPIDDLRRQLEVNVISQVAVTQAFLPLLRTARGRILSTGSIAGFFAAPALGAYSISKHAMEAFSDALRRELRPWGIEVSLLEPGAIATEHALPDGQGLHVTKAHRAPTRPLGGRARGEGAGLGLTATPLESVARTTATRPHIDCSSLVNVCESTSPRAPYNAGRITSGGYSRRSRATSSVPAR